MLAFFRSLGLAGSAGLVVSIALGLLLGIQKLETRHWHKQSEQWEKKYHLEHDAFTKTVTNYRAAAVQARAADAANKARVAAEQRAINERTARDYEARLAAARALADRLRRGTPAADPGRSGTTPVPGLQPSASGAPDATGQDGFSLADRLTATEQAIQLDELIKWVRKQAGVDVNGAK